MFVLIGMDIVIVWCSILAAGLFVSYDGQGFVHPDQLLIYAAVATVICPVVMYVFKLYNRVWQYASVGELMSIVKAVSVICLSSYAISTIVSNSFVPMSLLILTFETSLLLKGGIRFGWRVFRDFYFKKAANQRRTLVIGAGDCGTLIAKELMFDRNSQMRPVAFIDDNPKKHHLQVLGLPIYGGRDRIAEVVDRLSIDDIVIALPSISKREISAIIEACKSTKAKLKIIPNLGDLIHGRITVKEIRDVDVEDLLGREPIKIDLQEVANYMKNKAVLVTGAGGSIGSELCRQISLFQPRKLLLLGHGENSIYNIEMELREKYPNLILETIIADVQDIGRMEQVFAAYSPQVVFHAAAHKHVPLMEKNPMEAIKNNVFGTRNVADCADRFGAERFVLISTDKAVNPTSVMGTTKRIAEMYVQSLNHYSKTKFAAVRFGNVLGSRGSVIPKFKEQIKNGGPVTVTHPDMTRYFMTIPEAVQLVIQAGAFADGGEVFVLDMGEPVKILDLAKDLIRLSGFEPNIDIEIAYSGIRPGEKLFEELLTTEEGLGSTKHNRIFIGKPSDIVRSELEYQMKQMEKTNGEDILEVYRKLQAVVPNYQKSDREKELSVV
jgi:FlaA1/EpsC-like NDP-sugar epimerase